MAKVRPEDFGAEAVNPEDFGATPYTPPKEPSLLKEAGVKYLRAGGGIPGIYNASTAIGARAQKEYDRWAYGAGGAVTDVASNLGASPEVAGALGYGTNVGIQALPIIASGELTKFLGKPVVEKGAEKLMQSALKPTWQDLKSGKASKAIDTLLNKKTGNPFLKGANPTSGGMDKFRKMVDDLDDQISERLRTSGATVNPTSPAGEPLTNLLGVWEKFKKQVNPNTDLASIQKAWSEFLNHPLLKGGPSAIPGGARIPVSTAHQIKTGTYQQLKSQYGKLGSGEIEAQKALARGLQQQTVKAVPEIGPLLKEQSELLNALSVAERRAMMALNNNPGGLMFLANTPGKMAAFLADKSTLFKSIIARLLNQQAGAIAAAPGQVTAGTAALLRERQ